MDLRDTLVDWVDPDDEGSNLEAPAQAGSSLSSSEC